MLERDARRVDAADVVDFAERQRGGARGDEEEAVLVLVGERGAAAERRGVERSHTRGNGETEKVQPTGVSVVEEAGLGTDQ